MLNSIRWSLLLWHAGLLAVVIAGFGAASYYGIKAARYQRIDAELERGAQLLASGIRYPPPFRGPGGPGDRGGFAGPGGGGGGGPDGMGGPGDDVFIGPDQPLGGRRGRGGRGFGGPGEGGPGGFNRQPDELGGRGGGFGPGDFGGPERGPGFGGPMRPNGRGDPRVDPQLAEIFVPLQIAQGFGEGEDGGMYYVIWDYDRNVIKTSRLQNDVPETSPRPTPMFTGNGPPTPESPKIRTRSNFREAFMNGPAGSRILVGKSMLPDQAELHRTAFLLAGAGAAVMLIGLAGSWVLALRVVRPIRAITQTAQDISATNLSRRIDLAGTQSELGTLGSVLNDTFARLESAFQQQVRFTADASHELRTPLAVIHTHTQLALSRQRSAEEYRKTIETCLRASGRMKGLVDSLLVLAKADAGRLSLEPIPFDLQDVVQDCMAMVAPLAQERHVTLDASLQAVELSADPSRVAQVVTNLLTNAIRYNHDGGHVQIAVSGDERDAVLTIADTGMGIPAENQPHLFERFYRVDAARSRELGGSGLGLAICKSIVEAHGGTIGFVSEFGRGTSFTVRLPRHVLTPPTAPSRTPVESATATSLSAPAV